MSDKQPIDREARCPSTGTLASVIDLASVRATRERPSTDLNTCEGRQRARAAATGEIYSGLIEREFGEIGRAVGKQEIALLDLELRVVKELGEVPNVVRRELRELLPVLEDRVTRRLAEPPKPPTVRWTRARRRHVVAVRCTSRANRAVVVCRRASAAPHERSAGATTAFPLAPCPDLTRGNAWNASMPYGPPRVPQRTAAPPPTSRPLTAAELAPYVPWEHATTVLVGQGVHRRHWPAPFDRDPATGALRPVDAERRKEIVVRCERLELKPDAYIFFAKAEVEAVLQSHRGAPRWRSAPNSYVLGDRAAPFGPDIRETEDAVYLHGPDAAALLLYEQVPPSSWPDVYVADSEVAEPSRVADRQACVPALLMGSDLGRETFLLDHEVQMVVRAAQASRAQPTNSIRNANDAIEQFNSYGSQTMARMRDELNARAVRAGDVPANKEPINQRTAPEIRTPAAESDSAAPAPARPRRARPEWHLDALSLLKDRRDMNAETLILALVKLNKGYDSDGDDEEGARPTYLMLPDATKVDLATVRNQVVRLKAELKALR